MKRKTTDLEKNLISKGFKLTQKNYAGKHSEKTLSYVYEGVYTPDLMIAIFDVVVILNAKREKITTIGIKDPMVFLGTGDIITLGGVKLLDTLFREINDFIYNTPKVEQNTDEIVEEIENETN